MALSKTTNAVFGLTIPNAYHRVEAVIIRTKESMTFHVRSYVSPDGAPFFAESIIDSAHDLAGANPIE